MHCRIALSGAAGAASSVRLGDLLPRSLFAAGCLRGAGERDPDRVRERHTRTGAASQQNRETDPQAAARKSPEGLQEAQAQEGPSGVRKTCPQEIRRQEVEQVCEQACAEVEGELHVRRQRPAGRQQGPDVILPRPNRAPRAPLVAALLAGALLVALTSTTPAGAEGTGSPWWRVSATTAPTNLPPGGEAKIFVTAINVGDGNVKATGDKVIVTDKLPPGLAVISSKKNPSGAIGIAGSLLESASADFNPGPVTCESHAASVTCTFEGPKPLIPFVPLEVIIRVKVGG